MNERSKMREGVRMARAKDVAKLLRGGVNDKTSPARLAEIMKALRHADLAKGLTPDNS